MKLRHFIYSLPPVFRPLYDLDRDISLGVRFASLSVATKPVEETVAFR